MECTAGEDQYDLRMLAGTNTKIDMHRLPGDSSLVISLCGPVNLTTDDSLSRCPFGTAACWYNDSADPLSLGEVDRGFNIISDFREGLELRYIGGSPCRPGGPPSQLLITLVCSEGAEVCGGILYINVIALQIQIALCSTVNNFSKTNYDLCLNQSINQH